LRFREPETIPIHPRFLPEAVNHTQPAKPTILWVRTLTITSTSHPRSLSNHL
jgi:hypothetical protein